MIDYPIYQEIKDCMKENGTLDEELLDRCYNLAYRVHEKQKRKSGEPYIIHPLHVGWILAQLLFSCDVVCAGFLHDVLEDGEGEFVYTKEELANMTNSHIADLVEAVTAIKMDADHRNLSKTELDKASLDKFLREAHANPEAYYVKLADRLHNLSTLESMKPVKQIGKVRETRRLLLPIAEELKAYYFQSRMEDYCFKYDNAKQYRIVEKKYSKVLKENEVSIQNLKEELSNLTSGKLDTQICLSQIFPRYHVYNRNLSKVYYDAVQKTNNLSYLDLSFTKEEIPILNIMLFVNEQVKEKRIHYFFTLYNECLYKKGYFWLEHGRDKKNHLPYVHLKDMYNNTYKFILVTKEEAHSYNVGNLDYLEDKNIPNADEYFKGSIDIYMRNGSKYTFVKGGTVLDCAFEILKEEAVYASYAIVNDIIPVGEASEKESLYQILNTGDNLIIVMGSSPKAEIDWFLHLTTKTAQFMLANYLKSKAE